MVERADPFHRIVEPARKPEPLAVIVNVGPPAVAEFGLIEVRVAVLGPDWLIVTDAPAIDTGADRAPPEFGETVRVTVAGPLPEAGPVMVIQLGSAEIVQEHDATP